MISLHSGRTPTRLARAPHPCVIGVCVGGWGGGRLDEACQARVKAGRAARGRAAAAAAALDAETVPPLGALGR